MLVSKQSMKIWWRAIWIWMEMKTSYSRTNAVMLHWFIINTSYTTIVQYVQASSKYLDRYSYHSRKVRSYRACHRRCNKSYWRNSHQGTCICWWMGWKDECCHRNLRYHANRWKQQSASSHQHNRITESASSHGLLHTTACPAYLTSI